MPYNSTNKGNRLRSTRRPAAGSIRSSTTTTCHGVRRRPMIRQPECLRCRSAGTVWQGSARPNPEGARRPCHGPGWPALARAPLDRIRRESSRRGSEQRVASMRTPLRRAANARRQRGREWHGSDVRRANAGLAGELAFALPSPMPSSEGAVGWGKTVASKGEKERPAAGLISGLLCACGVGMGCGERGTPPEGGHPRRAINGPK
jgi:hypothetical protein